MIFQGKENRRVFVLETLHAPMPDWLILSPPPLFVLHKIYRYFLFPPRICFFGLCQWFFFNSLTPQPLGQPLDRGERWFFSLRTQNQDSNGTDCDFPMFWFSHKLFSDLRRRNPGHNWIHCLSVKRKAGVFCPLLPALMGHWRISLHVEKSCFLTKVLLLKGRQQQQNNFTF